MAAVDASRDAILQKEVFKTYKEQEFAGDDAGHDSIKQLRDHMQQANDASVCLVCLEVLLREDPVWSCVDGCYDTVHLACIQAWARQQILAANVRKEATDSSASRPGCEPLWCCPKCRHDYRASQLPSKYRCYCGAEEDPCPSAWLPAHSCGGMCSRELACGHQCLLLCHPGPCPVCPRQVAASCHCGKKQEEKRCHQSHFSCGKLCGQRHSCGHRCPLICHQGFCPPCKLTCSRSCECGARTAAVPCADEVFRCGRVCNRQLACGRHTCDVECHAGACGDCALTGPRRCPCGKVSHSGLNCEEATPTCGGTCDKLLQCGEHRCAERCHVGPCSSVCRALAVRSCSCGRLRKEAPCCESLRCETKCSRMRACGRHPCRRRCCDGNCPPCPEECKRLLRCRNHRCRAACHQGACLPCPLQLRVTCACGAASCRLPCGWEARAVPPSCDRACPVRRACRHATQLPAHRCHYGPCPPCDIPCGTTLPCGHTCASLECHDAMPLPIPPFEQPLPPQHAAAAGSDPSAAAMAIAEAASAALAVPPPVAEAVAAAEALAGAPRSSCPECRQPLEQLCQGLHTTHISPCCDSDLLVSCDRLCARQLSCGSHFEDGLHRCSRACHPTIRPDGQPVAMTAGTEALAGCDICDLVCGRARGCGHHCQEGCHAGSCPACREDVSLPCHCGRASIVAMCSALMQDASGKLLGCGKACHAALPGCPHLCQDPCHPGSCPHSGAACKQEVAVRCGCRHRKARWPCRDVQSAVMAAGQGSSFLDGATQRLLPCDAGCAALQAKKPSKKPLAVDPTPVGRTEQGKKELVEEMRRRDRQRMPCQPGSQPGSQSATSHQSAVAASLAGYWQKNWRSSRRWMRKNAVPALLLSFGLFTVIFVYRTLA